MNGEATVVGRRPAWWLGAAALAAAVTLGAALRWHLAGWALPAGNLPNLRSAHSHLGYYGVVFPFAWAAWHRMGLRVPSARWMWVYAAAVVASVADFAAEGYAPVSIAGSTLVLGTWIVSAWPLRRLASARDWLAPALPCVVLAAAAIPVVAVLSRRGDPRAAAWVHTFLAWLLLGVAVPTALRLAGARAMPGPVQCLAVLGSGLALGVWDGIPARLLLAAEGLLVAWAGSSLRADRVAGALWSVLGAGLVAVASGLVPDHPYVAVAGLHLALLGPVLVTLAWPSDGAARAAYAALAVASCAAIAAQPWVASAGWPRVVAALGSLVALAWLAALARAVASR